MRTGSKETPHKQHLESCLQRNENAEPEEDCETADSDTSLVPRSRMEHHVSMSIITQLSLYGSEGWLPASLETVMIGEISVEE
jgi:hypothetical protein